MAEIGCCSPNWDPFALSSSQSSDAESVNNDGSLEGSSRKNVMSMSCSPMLSAANIAAASVANGDIVSLLPYCLIIKGGTKSYMKF